MSNQREEEDSKHLQGAWMPFTVVNRVHQKCSQVDVSEREDDTGGPGDVEDDFSKNVGYSSADEGNENKVKEEAVEQKDTQLFLRWPDTRWKQAAYLFLLPIILPLWLTVPDVRNKVRLRWMFYPSCSRNNHFFLFIVCVFISAFALQKSRRFFVVTYLFSIVWIGVFSYLFMWWAHQVKFS